MKAFAVMACAVALTAGTGLAQAQDTIIVAPRGGTTRGGSRVAQRAVDLFNAPTTTRVFGELVIGRDDIYTGDVGALDGPLVVSGVVEGRLVAINAQVELTSSAEIMGDVLILGGTLTRSPGAEIRGSLSYYSARVLVRRVRDVLVLVEEPREPTRVVRRPRWRSWGSGDASLVFSLGGTYNRVEGLPIRVGPRIRWNGPVGGQIEAVGIVRTAGDFDSNREDLGYDVDGSLRFGWGSSVSVGGRAYDVVAPIETWGFHGDEIALASFFWHRDYRDYYLTRGVAGYIRIEPGDQLTLSGQIAREEDLSIAARDPWTLFRGDDVWRANPLVDEGTFTRISAGLEFDTRYSPNSRQSGWLLKTEWERGISDDVLPVALPASVRGPVPLNDYTYDRLLVDLRRYQRIGWGGQLRLRAFGVGSIGDQPLPVQRRVSLGGPALMPGYPFRAFACNAGVADPSLPALCDRMVLFQAEYRGDLSFGLLPYRNRQERRRRERARSDWLDRDNFWEWDEWFWVDAPDLVLFADAGAAWLKDEGTPNELEWDVGAGIEFGGFGVYATKAIAQDESLRFTLRMHRRF